MYKTMIVEDEMFVRMGIKISVKWEDMGIGEVSDYENGRQAWEAYQKERPDIILTDLKMPMMDGMELIRKIRENDRRTRIIILSCMEEFAMVREALSLGVTDYILKLTMTQEDMITIIKKALEELKNIDYARKTEEITIEQLEHLLMNVIHYEAKADLEKLSGYTVPFVTDNLMMAVIRIDQIEKLKEQFDDKYGDIVNFSVRNILNESMERFMKGIVLCENECTYIILTSQQNEQPLSVGEYHFEEMLKYIKKIFYTYFEITVFITVSRTCNQLKNLGIMYRQCEEVIAERFFYPSRGILYYSEVTKEDKTEMVSKQLEKFLKEDSMPSRSRSLLERVKIELAKNRDPEKFFGIYLRMAEAELRDLIISDQQRIQQMEKIQQSLKYVNTLQEMQEVYIEFVKQLMTTAFGTTGFVSKPVSMAVEYIKKNYQKDILLEDIATYVEMSSNYICSLFKKEMGMNISKYVMEYRIIQAKKLLVTTNMKSYEVAVTVGFANESYFSRSFKKMTGYSPSEYRHEICQIPGGV